MGSNNEITRWRAKLGEHLPTVVNALIQKVQEGDVAAMRLVLSRTLPPLKAEELPVDIKGFTGSRVELIAAVVEALASGRIDTARGGRLISLLSPSELDERAARIESALEARNDDDENEERV